MNVNTYDATPLYEGTISGKFNGRVYKDGSVLEGADHWYELRPGLFGLGSDLQDARDWYRQRLRDLVDLDYLRETYPNGVFVSFKN